MAVTAPAKPAGRLLEYWHRPEIRDMILDNLIWLILVIALIGFSFIPGFLNPEVLMNVLLYSTFIGTLVIGETLCLLTGNFDLSVESTLAFTAMFAAVLMGTGRPTPGWGISPVLVLPAMLAVGGLIGALNGFCVTKLKVNPFIVTLATMIIFRGLTIVFTSSQAVINFPSLYKDVGTATVGPVPLLGILLLVLYGFFHFIITRTLFGRKLFAVGGDAQVSFAFGLEPDKVVLLAFVLSGALAALGGWFLSARLNAATPGLGTGMTFDVMAAAVIGGISLKGGRGSLIGALGGVLLLSAINTALTVALVPVLFFNVVRGLVIFLAVGLDTLKERVR